MRTDGLIEMREYSAKCLLPISLMHLFSNVVGLTRNLPEKWKKRLHSGTVVGTFLDYFEVCSTSHNRFLQMQLLKCQFLNCVYKRYRPV